MKTKRHSTQYTQADRTAVIHIVAQTAVGIAIIVTMTVAGWFAFPLAVAAQTTAAAVVGVVVLTAGAREVMK